MPVQGGESVQEVSLDDGEVNLDDTDDDDDDDRKSPPSLDPMSTHMTLDTGPTGAHSPKGTTALDGPDYQQGFGAQSPTTDFVSKMPITEESLEAVDGEWQGPMASILCPLPTYRSPYKSDTSFGEKHHTLATFFTNDLTAMAKEGRTQRTREEAGRAAFEKVPPVLLYDDPIGCCAQPSAAVMEFFPMLFIGEDGQGGFKSTLPESGKVPLLAHALCCLPCLLVSGCCLGTNCPGAMLPVSDEFVQSYERRLEDRGAWCKDLSCGAVDGTCTTTSSGMKQHERETNAAMQGRPIKRSQLSSVLDGHAGFAGGGGGGGGDTPTQSSTGFGGRGGGALISDRQLITDQPELIAAGRSYPHNLQQEKAKRLVEGAMIPDHLRLGINAEGFAEYLVRIGFLRKRSDEEVARILNYKGNEDLSENPERTAWENARAGAGIGQTRRIVSKDKYGPDTWSRQELEDEFQLLARMPMLRYAYDARVHSARYEDYTTHSEDYTPFFVRPESPKKSSNEKWIDEAIGELKLDVVFEMSGQNTFFSKAWFDEAEKVLSWFPRRGHFSQGPNKQETDKMLIRKEFNWARWWGVTGYDITGYIK
jgi:hypothetical protein